MVNVNRAMMKLRHYLDKSRSIMLATLPAVEANGRKMNGYSVPLVFYMYWN